MTTSDSTKKKSRGRPRNENFLPWEEARELIRAELLPSRGKFFEWWDKNKPKAIPRYPYRVYTEWTTWNDFLGTNNKFSEKAGTKWRPYHEAVIWVHKQKIASYAEWMEFCKQEGALPADIPARPDFVYSKWVSWNHWLGNTPVEAVQAKQQSQRVALYYILRDPAVPSNVFTFGVEMGGMSALKERWSYEQFEVVKLFWFDKDKSEIINQIVHHFSTPYLGNESERIVPNVWDIIWHLQLHLETVRN